LSSTLFAIALIFPWLLAFQKIKKFPGVLLAGTFGFDKKEYFRADPRSQTAPDVDFGGNG